MLDKFDRGLLLRRAAAQETLDGDPIRFFILKIIFRISSWICVVCDREFNYPGLALVPVGIPSLDCALIGVRIRERLLLGLYLLLVFVSRVIIYLILLLAVIVLAINIISILLLLCAT